MNMSKSLFSALVVCAIAFWSMSVPFVGTASADSPVSRTSNSAGVQVVVTPNAIDPKAKVWEFTVALNTHTTPLTVDLAKAAMLTDDAGHRYAPLAWQGDPPGGHHRKGVLQFPAPAGSPKVIELKIKGIAGPTERVFKWELK